MTRLAPTWALSAAAINGLNDAHLQPGVHLRVLPHQVIGLPLAPLLVDRYVLGDGQRIPEANVLWTDARGDPLSVSFDLAPASPATAWLPSDPDNPVIYAEVLLEGTGRRRELGPPDRFWRDPHFLPRRPLPKSGVRVDAIVTGLHGPSVVATATTSRYQVCATGMDRVQVSGAGTVLGIRILRANHVKPSDGGWRRLALPIERGARYEGIGDAWDRAIERVARGAPQRFGMHDQPYAPDPGSCDTVGPSEELERVKFLWSARIEPMVIQVIDDLGAPPDQLLTPAEPMEGTAVATASVAVPPLAAVLQGALDPGVGRLLGLVELDDDPEGDEGEIVAYVVRGAWQVHAAPGNWLATLLLFGAPANPTWFPLPLPPGRDGEFVDLWTVAATVVGREAAPMSRPAVGPAVDLGWVPVVPPDARRHVAIPLSHLLPGASIALARETPDIVGLNSRLVDIYHDDGPDRAVPIVPGVLAETDAPAASGPGQGEVHDPNTPEYATDYRVAQSDWFGRWSPWAETSVGDGVRPPVPVPVIEAVYVDPATPGSPGTLHIRCFQVHDDDLPAGAFELDEVRVEAFVGGATPATGSASAVRGPAPSGTDAAPLVVSFTVPALAPAEKRLLTATARWWDVGGRGSEPCPPAQAQAVDPRAPAPLVLPNTLEYAARPDALGRSRVRVAWPAAANTGYRIYLSDETTLRQRLATLVAAGRPGAAAAQSALGAATTAPDRAAVFRMNAGLFDKTCFELLTRSPILASVPGPLTFDHEVSGSLRVLLFFKVVPVSVLATAPVLQLGGEASFEASTLLPRGIPNGASPPVPLLSIEPDPADPARVRLKVSVPAGQTAPAALRLRRSRVSGADALAMPVVLTATPAAWPAVVGDDGSMPWDSSLRFAPWSTYTWRAEVQGPPEPGSTPPLPGLWSGASAPVSWKVVPPPPAGVNPGSATPSATGMRIRFTSPDALDGGGEGAYVLDVYRVTPPGSGVPSGAVGSYPAATRRQPDGSYLVEDTTPGIPAGTSYLVEVCDPLGRRSPRVTVA